MLQPLLLVMAMLCVVAGVGVGLLVWNQSRNLPGLLAVLSASAAGVVTSAFGLVLGVVLLWPSV